MSRLWLDCAATIFVAAKKGTGLLRSPFRCEIDSFGVNHGAIIESIIESTFDPIMDVLGLGAGSFFLLCACYGMSFRAGPSQT